jgi:hypothetical protein
LTIRKEIYGLDHEKVAESLSVIGIVYREVNKFVEAQMCYEESLAITVFFSRYIYKKYFKKIKKYGQDDINVADIFNNLAVVYLKLGKRE